MIRALLSWFYPTRIYFVTSGELMHALRVSGFKAPDRFAQKISDNRTGRIPVFHE